MAVSMAECSDNPWAESKAAQTAVSMAVLRVEMTAVKRAGWMVSRLAGSRAENWVVSKAVHWAG